MKHKLLNKLLLLLLCILGGASSAWATVVTYTVTSTSAVSTSGTAPTGSSVAYSQTYGTAKQATADNSFTLTLKNWEGYSISNITLSMHSNAKAGAGNLAYSTDGGTTYSYIIGSNGTGINFNDSRWNDSYTSSWVDISKDVVIDASSSDIVIKINATTKSLYCESYKITYDTTSSSSAESTTTTIDDSGITNKNIYVGTDAGSFSAAVKDESDKAVDGATVTWTSSDTGVATINSSTGAVTLVAAGTTTITASYAGVTDTYKSSSDTYLLTVTNIDPSIVTIWSEDFGDGYSANATTYSYSLTSASVRESDNYAGGKSPEMMLNASSGIFTATIPLNGDYTGSMTLTYRTNAKSLTVNSTTVGVSGSATTETKDKHSLTFTGITTSMDELVVKFAAGGENVRLDDIELTGKRAPTAPTFSHSGGDILKGSTITLSADDGCTIYYTTNGSTPTNESTEYTGAITISTAQTIKAVAIDAKGVSSKVVSATYTLLKPDVPTFSVAAKIFKDAFDTTISSATGTTLKYTTDGTNPSSSGTATAVDSNSKTINISGTSDVTVKAIAILDGVESNVAEVTYEYDARPAPTFSLSSTEFNLKVNEASSVTLTTNTDGTVTATSSDGTHLPVSYNSGTKVCSFTPNLAGDYTITINVPATSNYLAAEATVTVHVTKKSTVMAIETDFSEGKDLRYGDEGLIEGTVKYNDVALSPQPEITYTSSNTSVATVNSDGEISFVGAGSTTFTVSYAGNDEYTACENTYVLNLIDTTPQEMEVSTTFNNTFFGISAITSWKTGDPTSATGTLKNVSITYAKSSGTYFYCNASQIRCYNGNTLSFTAPEGYVFEEITFSSSDWNEATPSVGAMNKSNTKKWEGSSNTVSFSWSSTTRIESATIILAETVTVSSAGYTSFVAKHDISFPATVTAYIATETGISTITLTSIESAPEGTAVVVKAAAGVYNLAVIDAKDADDVSDNILKAAAADGSTKGDGSTIYALGVGRTGANKDKVGFYLVGSGVTVPAGKAYLEITSPVKEFLTFDFGDEPDGIKTVDNRQQTTDNSPIYNLAGQRLNKMQKGINIVNGKKILK